MAKKKIVIPFELQSLEADLVQYKPYKPVFIPCRPLVVEFVVKLDEDDHWASDEDITLTPKGFMDVLRLVQEEVGLEVYRMDLQLDEEKLKIAKEEGI